MGGAGDASHLAGELNALAAAGEADAVHDVGNRADAGVLVALAGNEQHSLVVADVDRQRDVHCREDDYVLKRQQEQRFVLLCLVGCRLRGGCFVRAHSYAE